MSVPNVLKTEVLKEEFMYLCDELGDPSRYFPHLRSKSLIDGKDCERIRSKVVSSEKTEELLNTLLSRKDAHGEHPLDVLISDLKKQRVQVHIARRLQRTLKKKTQTVETTNGGFPRSQSPSSESTDLLGVSSAKPVQRAAINASSYPTPSKAASYAINPGVGPIPNDPPPLSAQTHSMAVTNQYHAQCGVGPSTPPPITRPSPHHMDGGGAIPKQARLYPADMESEPGGQSMADGGQSMADDGQSMAGRSLTDSSLFEYSAESSPHSSMYQQSASFHHTDPKQPCVSVHQYEELCFDMKKMKVQMEALQQENSRLLGLLHQREDLLHQRDSGPGHRPGTLFPQSLYPPSSDPSGLGHSRLQSPGRSNTNHSMTSLGETSSTRSTSSTSVNSNPSLPSTPRTQFQSYV